MAALIIQHKAKHGRLAEFSSHSGESVTVGRALKNDIILSDPYIAPEQVRISPAEENWLIHILDHTNPVMINGKEVTGENIEIQSGDQLVLGRTHLSLFTDDHPVEATRKLVLTHWWHQHMFKPASLLVLLAVVSILRVGYDFQGMSTTIKWGQLIYPVMMFLLLVFIWSGIWSLVGRLLRHQPNFSPQLFFTTLIFGIWIFVTPLTEYVEYISNSVILSELMLWLLLLVTCGILLKYNLTYATNIRNTTRTSFLFVACTLLFIYGADQFSKDDYLKPPQYSRIIKPVASALLNDISLDNLLKNYDAQFSHVEK